MSNIIDVLVPDIGNVTDVDVIEVLVSVGDQINVDDSLITLESDKASMEVPSSHAGTVKELKMAVGDKASEGSLVLTLEVAAEGAKEKPESKKAVPKKETPKEEPKAQPAQKAEPSKPQQPAAPEKTAGKLHASPSVRRLARELDIDLSLITGTGRKDRITKDDLQAHIKARMSQGSGGGIAVASAPPIDFSKFGETERQALTKINKLTGSFLHRNWVTVPHVTQFDEADITEMEAFRKQEKANAEKLGYKLTPLVFIMKAAVAALKAYPRFNSSLEAGGDALIMKKYFHIGVAVDTPNGLMVPVIRDVDTKSLFDLAKELGEISERARTKGLMPNDMQGGCFTISSLGGISGTAFTPIVNVPEVAILGVSRSSMKPIYKDGTFEPRLMLPLSLSYDHRVIDGADGARFSKHLVNSLSDIRTLLL